MAVSKNQPVPEILLSERPGAWCAKALSKAHSKLTQEQKEDWLWWRLPMPPTRRTGLADLIDVEPDGVTWRTDKETEKLLGMMSRLNLSKVEMAQKTGRRTIGAIYKRTLSQC